MRLSQTFFVLCGFAVLSGQVCVTWTSADEGKLAASQSAPATPLTEDSQVIPEDPEHQIFNHKKHVDEAGLDCDSCHPDPFTKENGNALSAGDFTMQAFTEGKYCGTCHDGDTAFEVTDSTTCVTCHGSDMKPPAKIVWNEPNMASFSHTTHIEDVGLECTACHSTIFAARTGAAEANKDFSMAAFQDGKYCGACHNGEDAFDTATQCDSCHFAPTDKIVFSDPVKSVVFDHKIHVGKAKLLCETCHKDVFTMGKEILAVKAADLSDAPEVKRQHLEALHEKFCGTCHNSSQAFGFQTRCTVCHIGVKGLERIKQKISGAAEHGKKEH